MKCSECDCVIESLQRDRFQALHETVLSKNVAASQFINLTTSKIPL